MLVSTFPLCPSHQGTPFSSLNLGLSINPTSGHGQHVIILIWIICFLEACVATFSEDKQQNPGARKLLEQVHKQFEDGQQCHAYDNSVRR
jgi:hypothetical protein